MVLNADQCRFLIVDFNKPFPDFNHFNDTTIENVAEEKNLGIATDNKLKFHLELYAKLLTKNSVYSQECQN